MDSGEGHGAFSHGRQASETVKARSDDDSHRQGVAFARALEVDPAYLLRLVYVE